MKNVLFFNKKGAQGKSTLAVGLTRYYKNSVLLTNDIGNSTGEVFKIPIIEIGHNTKIEDVEIGDYFNIFDFGGYIDSRVLTLAKIVDTIVVPICYQSELDLVTTLQTLEKLATLNKNIVVVVNNTDKEYIDELVSFFSEKHKVFVIPKSKYLQRTDETVFDIYKKGGLDKYMVGSTKTALETLYKYLGDN